MSTSLVITDPNTMWAMAERLGTAGPMLPDHIKSAGAAYAVLLAGAELGMPPMVALRSIHIVKGKVTLAADAQLAICRQAGIEWEWLSMSDRSATIKMTRNSLVQAGRYVEHTHTFTIEEAKTAGLLYVKQGKQGGPWHTYPAAMLRARCASAAIRAFCPDVLMGCYLPEELEVQQVGEPEYEPPAEPPAPAAKPVERPAGQCECGPTCTRPQHEKVGGAAWKRFQARVTGAGVTYDDVKVVYQLTGKHLPKTYGPGTWDSIANSLETADGALAFRSLLANVPLDEPPEVDAETVTEDEQHEADERAAMKENR